MKILYVTTISDTVNAFLIPHIKFLIDQGHEVGVACNIVQEVDYELTRMAYRIHPIPFQRNPLKKDNILAYKEIKRVIFDEGYEWVHVHTPVASFLTRFACRNRKDLKVLYTAHGFHFFKGAPAKNWIIYYLLEKIAARWTDTLITMNDEDYDSAKKLKLKNKNSVYKVRGIGLDLNKFLPQKVETKNGLREEYHYHRDDFILIYVGELSYRKHQDLLIEAIGRVKGEIPNIKLLLVGDGELAAQYKELVVKLELEKTVEFLGYRKDIPHLIRLSDVAISTSRQEGLPVNVMEAMSTGLPLIVTDCRGNRDLVRHGSNGFVVGVDDTEACAEAIKQLYHSKELRSQFAKESRRKIQEYSIDHVIQDMKKIYLNM